MPDTCMLLWGRLSAPEFIAGIFLTLILFHIRVLWYPAPYREQGFGPTMEKKNQLVMIGYFLVRLVLGE